MQNDQIAEELQSLADRLDRLEVALDDCIHRIDQVHDRAIPAATADLKHAQTGLSTLLVNQAGTIEKLAQVIRGLNDQVQVLERAID